MDSSKTAAILNHMIENEVVKFEDDTGGAVLEIHKSGSSGMFTLTVQSRNGTYISSIYFNRYSEEGSTTLRLYWDSHIVGQIYTRNVEVESESIYS